MESDEVDDDYAGIDQAQYIDLDGEQIGTDISRPTRELQEVGPAHTPSFGFQWSTNREFVTRNVDHYVLAELERQ
ncbi:hypothetical protein TNCV_3024361 [Trichonephila clavipes]|nr:hypothetical protein TNCV_3024361 [Trichonephila clavipes]